jgi:hypothetical protein
MEGNAINLMYGIWTPVTYVTTTITATAIIMEKQSPLRPEQLWGPPSLLSNGYQRISPWG